MKDAVKLTAAGIGVVVGLLVLGAIGGMIFKPSTDTTAQQAPDLSKACSRGQQDCYLASAYEIFCTTPTAVEEQTGHGRDKVFLDSLGCVELARSDVTMLKIDTDYSDNIWRVYILGDRLWTWARLQ